MGEEEKYRKNDTVRKIDEVIQHVKDWDSPQKNGGACSHLVTKLIEARMIALLIVNEPDGNSQFRKNVMGKDAPTPEERGEKPKDAKG